MILSQLTHDADLKFAMFHHVSKPGALEELMQHPYNFEES